jgi:hypothetical protein
LSPTITIAPVRKSVVVRADPARAFEVFAAGFDRWWPKKLPPDPEIARRMGATSAVKESLIEPFKGGGGTANAKTAPKSASGTSSCGSRDAAWC